MFRCSLFALFTSLTVILGCGGGSGEEVYSVSGKVTKAGSMWHPKDEMGKKALPPGDAGCTIIFEKKGDKPDSFNAVFNPETSTFHMPGITGKGIPAGEYEVRVYLGAGGGGPNGPGSGNKELLKKMMTIPKGGAKDLHLELPAK
ncbi:MAG: hypothetical protein ACRC8S_18475 [Fimbriiglobus sp.]